MKATINNSQFDTATGTWAGAGLALYKPVSDHNDHLHLSLNPQSFSSFPFQHPVLNSCVAH